MRCSIFRSAARNIFVVTKQYFLCRFGCRSILLPQALGKSSFPVLQLDLCKICSLARFVLYQNYYSDGLLKVNHCIFVCAVHCIGCSISYLWTDYIHSALVFCAYLVLAASSKNCIYFYVSPSSRQVLLPSTMTSSLLELPGLARISLYRILW